MATTIVVALVLGTSAGMAPGPYTTMVAGTALEKGFKPAFRLALTPLVTDVPPLLVTALILETLSGTALTVLGAFGGLAILYIGFRFLSQWRTGETPVDPEHPRVPQSARFWHVALGTLVSPAPWLFWLIVGSPFMLRSFARSRTEGIVFVAVLFTTNMATATALAWGASHGRRILAPAWQRRVLGGVGVTLILAAAFLLYHAATGDFQSLISNQELLRDVVEEQITNP